jgi:hypothetical protein
MFRCSALLADGSDALLRNANVQFETNLPSRVKFRFARYTGASFRIFFELILQPARLISWNLPTGVDFRGNSGILFSSRNGVG